MKDKSPAEWNSFKKNFKRDFRKLGTKVYAVNIARRRIIHYYITALQLYQNNECIDEKFLKVICEGEGFDLFYKVGVDLEKLVRESLNKKFAAELVKLRLYSKII